MRRTRGLVVYDMDGVVIDNMNECFRTLRGTLEEFGVTGIRLPTFRSFLESFSNPPHSFYSQFGVAWSEAEKVFRHLARIHFQTEGLYLGALGSIKRLRLAGYKTAIVSSGYPDVVKARLRRFRLTHLFDEVVPGQAEKALALQFCSRKHLFATKQTFFVGDLTSDMRDAKLAGVRGIGFSAEHFFMRPVLTRAGAEYCVDTHEELVERLAA